MTKDALPPWSLHRFRIVYSHSTKTDDIQHGRPLAIDHNAHSASPTEPAFIARPEGTPVYHGFVVLDDVTVEGFTLGKITDFEAHFSPQMLLTDGMRRPVSDGMLYAPKLSTCSKHKR